MDYIFARMVLGIVGLGSFALMALGVLLAVTGAGIGAGSFMQSSYAGVLPAAVLAAIPGTIVAFMGVFLMAVVDHFSATLDTATYTKKMLRIAEDQLKVSKQTLKLGELAQAGYAGAGDGTRGPLGAHDGSRSRGFLGFFGKKDGSAKRASSSPSIRAAREPGQSLPPDEADTRAALAQAPDADDRIAPTVRPQPRLSVNSGLAVPETAPLAARAVDPDRPG